MTKPAEKLSVPPQKFSGYNRESGNKTLRFVGVMLAIITTLIVVVLYLYLT